MIFDANWTNQAALNYVHWRISPRRGTILELGSGYSTEWFTDRGHMVTSVEHDPAFVDNIKSVDYKYVPIELYSHSNPFPGSIRKRTSDQIGWYNRDILQKALGDMKFDVIFVDGPNNDIGRAGFLLNLDLFVDSDGVPKGHIVFDDMHRVDDLYIAQQCASKLERDLVISHDDPHRPYGFII